MLPIVPGCQAIVINSKNGNDGISLTVNRFLGELGIGFLSHKDWWEVSKPLQFSDGTEHKVCPESMLLRIDGFGDEIRDVTFTIRKKENA